MRSGRWLLMAAAWIGLVSAATPNAPVPIPPPLPPPSPPPKSAGHLESLVPPSDAPWGLSAELLEPLYQRAADYAAFARRFTCDETARLADYDQAGTATRERTRRYGYLLVRSDASGAVREYRQELGRDGSLKPGEVEDIEPFPPAYLWVFLFSRFHEPYFAYRYVGERFDGFDWVHEIQFKGSLPFTDGKDIREWQGVVLVDAVTHTPLEIRAEPTGQAERIEELYRRHMRSFNLFGTRTAPRPLGYRAWVQLRYRDRESGLRFPTDLRYDTFEAVSLDRVVAVRASTRSYSDYRIFDVSEAQTLSSP